MPRKAFTKKLLGNIASMLHHELRPLYTMPFIMYVLIPSISHRSGDIDLCNTSNPLRAPNQSPIVELPITPFTSKRKNIPSIWTD